ncbi:MAG TPA: class I SAM-dependent methyltransferase [Solirubrobacteraceae bacterium]|jgi:SAM-dependent methyltransferase|nr:class I SAM-dependent methyltransferase [Solirubrobacteraceae bacterium]
MLPTEIGSEPYDPRNVLDRLSRTETLESYYRHVERRERALIERHLGIAGGEVLSIGCGWHPGRHLFPRPQFQLTGVDLDPARVQSVLARGEADFAFAGAAGALELPNRCTDVVLYRLVLHHLVYREPLVAAFTEAACLLRPGGALVAIEPGLWHPVGAALALANRTGIATALHGTPDDIPLSPARLVAEARKVGLAPELHSVTFAWRRLPPALQRLVAPLDALGSRRALAPLGHTLMLIARKPGVRC